MTNQHTDPDRIVQLLPADGWHVYELTEPHDDHNAYHRRRTPIAAWALDGHGTVRALVPGDNGDAVPVRLDRREFLAHKRDPRLIEPTIKVPPVSLPSQL